MTFRLAAREGSSESRAHLLTPYQIRWVPVPLLLFSVFAFAGATLSCYGKESKQQEPCPNRQCQIHPLVILFLDSHACLPPCAQVVDGHPLLILAPWPALCMGVWYVVTDRPVRTWFGIAMLCLGRAPLPSPALLQHPCGCPVSRGWLLALGAS